MSQTRHNPPPSSPSGPVAASAAALVVGLIVSLLVGGCGASTAGGGRLYDKWHANADFRATSRATTPDGSGGPRGNGTLLDGDGKVLLNTAGHSYRFKSFWGWDLKGAAGIYGPQYQNKATVRPENLLTDPRTPTQLAAWLRTGAPGVPAWGSVMSKDEIALLVTFIDAMRTGLLPRADDIWTLSTDAPKHYTLNAGGDPARGAALVRQRCAGCHGPRGQKIKIDQHYSLGAFARANGYEAWFKILAGQPGTDMGGQVPHGLDRKASAAFILDVLAGLCDRTKFPSLKGGKDVADGDLRCGAYLK